MRTKTLLLTAAVGVASLASVMAQPVYSVNVVGYHNVNVAPNSYSIIANQLSQTDSRLSAIIPAPPLNSVVIKYSNGAFQLSTYEEQDDGSFAWSNPNITLTPGEGAWFRNRSAGTANITFVGEVQQGNLSHPVPNGFSMQSSQVPQAGGIQSLLGYTPNANDRVYLYRNNAYQIRTYEEQDDGSFAWSGGEPDPQVGEGFWILNPNAPKQWARTFNITN